MSGFGTGDFPPRPTALSAVLEVTQGRCLDTDHYFDHAEVPAEGRVYLYCRKCGEVRKLEVAKTEGTPE